MPVNEVEEIFKDAESLYQEALKELEVGKIRKAAENAWCATLRATDALILSRTGKKPVGSDVTTDRLHYLALKYPEIEILIGGYHTRSDYLHGKCFYFGSCPEEPVRRRIIETKQYIEDAKKLAGIL
jgi:uncharacterized protein (UPF0332 family)